MIVASVKGFGPGPYEECKVYENVAQCAGGSASTTGFDDGPPLVTGRADRRQRHRTAPGARHRGGALPTQRHRPRSKVLAAMQDGVLNLCRVKLRDQQRLARTGVMKEYPQYPQWQVRQRRAACGQRFGRRTAGHHPQVQGLGDRSERLSVLHRAGAGMEGDLQCDRQRRLDHRSRTTPRRMRACRGSKRCLRPSKTGRSRRPSSRPWTLLNEHDIPCGPILSMEELADEPIVARHRHHRRSGPSETGQIPDRGQSHQDERQPHRGHALAPARRTHG